MKNIGLFFGMLALIVFSGCGSTQTAKAVLHNAKGEVVGKATLLETPEGVKISLAATGVPRGTHAFHIHEAGSCEAPDFKSAGGHFNPHGKKHGHQNPDGAHAGDLQDIQVGWRGKASVEQIAKEVTLGRGNHSLFHRGGTSLVIHADPDDNVSDPAGNAGTRIACGVIEKGSI